MASTVGRPNGYHSHPAAGAVQTAAQKALMQERTSLTSTSTAFAATRRSAASAGLDSDLVAAADGGHEDHDGTDSPLSASPTSAQEQHAHRGTHPHTQPQQQPLTSAAAAAATAESNSSNVAEGMRREWRFALQFVHQAGQLLVQCAPQWEYEFIDMDCTALGLAQRELAPEQVDVAPMLTALSYTDRTAVMQAQQGQQAPPGSAMSSPAAIALAMQHRTSTSRTSLNTAPGAAGSARGAAGVAAAAADPLGAHRRADNRSSVSSVVVGDSAGVASVAGGEDRGDSEAWWVEKLKGVELLYCHPPPGMDLEGFCKRCVQFVLNDPHVASVDGDVRLSRLRMGDKLRCPHRLGGHHRSFQFRYTVRHRAELQESYVYVIGAIAGQRGYLLRARCTDPDELEGYVRTALLPAYTTPGRAQFGVDVTYHNVAPTTLLSEQQEAFGELQYVDLKAAIVFVTPLYPMRVLPDYSPAETVGVGSITCLTLELSVYERLLDDTVAAQLIGVAKYKVSPVIMCVEVEEVSRMGYPKVMSTEQYSDLKAARIAEVFADTKMVGLPTNQFMGDRTGRSRTMTFTYEPLRCVVKALITSTLVGNLGVTALYLTRPSGGVFDAHLYVFQQLLGGMEYLPQNNFAKNARVSRYRSQNIRLVEEDVLRAYRINNSYTGGVVTGAGTSSSAASAAAAGVLTQRASTGAAAASGTGGGPGPAAPLHPTMFAAKDPRVVGAARDRHLHFLALGNDGRVEGGIEALVPPEEGGFVATRRGTTSRAAGAAAAAAAGTHAHGASRGGGAAAGGEGDSASTAAVAATAAQGAGGPRSSLFSNSILTASLGGDAFMAATAASAEAMTSIGAAAAAQELSTSSAHSESRISAGDISRLIDSGSVTPAVGVEPPSESEDALSTATGDDRDAPGAGRESGLDVAQLDAAAVGRRSSTGHGRTTTRHHHSRGGDGDHVGDDAKAQGSAQKRGGSASAGAPPDRISTAAGGAETGDGLVTSLASSTSALSASKLHGCTAGDSDTGTRAATAAGCPDAAAGRLGSTQGPGRPPAAAAGALDGDEAAATSAAAAARLEQQQLYEQLVGKGDPAVQQALREVEGGTLYGPSLRDVYARCCEAQQCRPNSYLMRKLPAQPELTYAVEEIDLSANYVGHNGFVAVLHLLEHLPQLRVVYFNNMSLDNVDAESLCYVLATNHTVREVHLENNTGISLPSMRHFTALLRVNNRIEVLALSGTRLSPTLVAKLQEEASQPRE